LGLKKARKAVATHGYDNKAPSMRASFVAKGPAFKEKLVVEPFDNIEVYGLIACALGIKPAQTDGNVQRVVHLLKHSCP
jgi:alkaline phosphatase D